MIYKGDLIGPHCIFMRRIDFGLVLACASTEILDCIDRFWRDREHIVSTGRGPQAGLL